jgi:hypothetical protein
MPCWRLLAIYYTYIYEMGKGYLKDPFEREKNLFAVGFWQADIEALERILSIFQSKPLG